jgi:proteasome lid subunit RPN8/RPN11
MITKIPESIIKRIIQQARDEDPLEACGYLAGTGNEVKEILPMSNIDRSPEHFSFSPEEQFDAFQKAQSSGYDLIGVYHTHPATPARMSAEDIRLAHDTSLTYMIYSLRMDEIKAFKIDVDKKVTELPIEVSRVG